MGELYFRIWFISKFIILISIGWMTFEQGFTSYMKIKSTQSWNKVEATVIEKAIETSISDKGSKSYYPHILYSYSVDDSTYESNQIHIGIGTANTYKFQAEEKISEYEIDQKITAIVNPKTPQESTLKIGDPNDEKPLMYMGVFFFLLAYLLNRKTINHFFKKLLLPNYSRKGEPWLIAK